MISKVFVVFFVCFVANVHSLPIMTLLVPERSNSELSQAYTVAFCCFLGNGNCCGPLIPPEQLSKFVQVGSIYEAVAAVISKSADPLSQVSDSIGGGTPEVLSQSTGTSLLETEFEKEKLVHSSGSEKVVPELEISKIVSSLVLEKVVPELDVETVVSSSGLEKVVPELDSPVPGSVNKVTDAKLHEIKSVANNDSPVAITELVEPAEKV